VNKARILIVEDDADVRRINNEYLNSQGYETVCSPTLKDARFQLEKRSPDLIILDVMLPDGSGLDFCKELRQRTTIPVIFLTCRDENENIVQGLLLGGDDYVIKPYDLNVLGARVAAQLRRAGITTAGKIELPPLSIDLLTGEVKLSGESIRLTQKELQLLSCFILYAGQRLDCDEIFHRAWGEKPGSPNTVAVHASSIRKKLKLDEDGTFELKNVSDGKYIFSKIRY